MLRIKRPSGASVSRKMRGFPNRNTLRGFGLLVGFFLRFFCFGASSVNSRRSPGVTSRTPHIVGILRRHVTWLRTNLAEVGERPSQLCPAWPTIPVLFFLCVLGVLCGGSECGLVGGVASLGYFGVRFLPGYVVAARRVVLIGFVALFAVSRDSLLQ